MYFLEYNLRYIEKNIFPILFCFVLFFVLFSKFCLSLQFQKLQDI